MKLSRKAAFNLETIIMAVSLGAIIGVLYGIYRYGYSPPIVPAGILTGGLIGLFVSAMALISFEYSARRFSFFTSLLIQSVLIMIVTFLSSLAVDCILGLFTSWKDYFNADLLWGLLFSLLMSWLVNFFLIVDRLLGREVFFSFLTGKYHHPVEEERIFMFLDLNSSTTIAEKLGHEQYHRFLNEVYAVISTPILECRGEIYQYVGDEAVITWTMKKGIKEARCLRCYFDIEKAVASKKDYFMNTFGFLPGFKAGLHCGKVMTAEIGAYKREIMFMGDVVNTTARIRSECGSKGKDLMLSGDLLDHLPRGTEFEPEHMGSISLKGKEKTVALYSIALKG